MTTCHLLRRGYSSFSTFQVRSLDILCHLCDRGWLCRPRLSRDGPETAARDGGGRRSAGGERPLAQEDQPAAGD
jgi:hypothetical protein